MKNTHVIHVDDETYLVVKSMQRSATESRGSKVSMNYALQTLLSHRQPGGWGAMVDRARMRDAASES